MAIIAIVFGYMQIILGGLFYIASVLRRLDVGDETNPWIKAMTALIPAAFGILLVILGTVAGRSTSERARMHVMHFAALLGLLGILLPIIRLIVSLTHGSSWGLPHTEMAVMALLNGVFLLLCVKSFIDVRRARKQAAADAVK